MLTVVVVFCLTCKTNVVVTCVFTTVCVYGVFCIKFLVFLVDETSLWAVIYLFIRALFYLTLVINDIS